MYIAYNSVLQYHAVTLIGYICIVSTNKDDSIVCLYICSQQSSNISQVRRCVVFGCNSDTTCINIRFHKLPEVLCSKWKAVIGRSDDFVVKKYFEHIWMSISQKWSNQMMSFLSWSDWPIKKVVNSPLKSLQNFNIFVC